MLYKKLLVAWDLLYIIMLLLEIFIYRICAVLVYIKIGEYEVHNLCLALS